MKASASMYFCDHTNGKCSYYHEQIFRTWANPPPPPSEQELDTLHNQRVAEGEQLLREWNDGALTETSTQVDPEEQEDIRSTETSTEEIVVSTLNTGAWNPSVLFSTTEPTPSLSSTSHISFTIQQAPDPEG
ncbi:MAG: hypothetical protein Q9178_003890 [Gyalolechia marmorata]